MLHVCLQDDAYNPYIRDLGKTHSVATLLTKNRQAADDDEAIKIISSADAIFFAGGDQWTYLQEWEGTALQKMVQKLIQEHNIPVGGTSAGCDIQGPLYTYTHACIHTCMHASSRLSMCPYIHPCIQPSIYQ